jgi:hypothetical protein
MLFLQRGRIFLLSGRNFWPFWPENVAKSWQHCGLCERRSLGGPWGGLTAHVNKATWSLRIDNEKSDHVHVEIWWVCNGDIDYSNLINGLVHERNIFLYIFYR